MIDRQMMQALLPVLMQMQQRPQTRPPMMAGLADLEGSAVDPTLSREAAEQMRQERMKAITGGGAIPAGLKGRKDLDIAQDNSGNWFYRVKGTSPDGQPRPWNPYRGK